MKHIIEPHFRNVITELKKLITSYTVLHKEARIPFEP